MNLNELATAVKSEIEMQDMAYRSQIRRAIEMLEEAHAASRVDSHLAHNLGNRVVEIAETVAKFNANTAVQNAMKGGR